MSDDPTVDPATGLLHRAAFLDEVRKGQAAGMANVRRGCLLILRFPVLARIGEAGGSTAATLALRNLLGIVETRLRSRDTIGRIGDHSLCILLRQCKEPDALLIAEQYVGLLRDVVMEAGEHRAPMDLHYRIVPLDWRGRRSRQGVSRVIKAPEDAARVLSASAALASVEDKGPDKVVRLTPKADAAPRVVQQAESTDQSAMIEGATYRLKPGLLLKHRPVICCYRLRPVGIAPVVLAISENPLFEAVLEALSLKSTRTRPLIESQLVVPVEAEQLSKESALWLKDQCRLRQVAPADICLSLRFESITSDLRKSLPALRRLNRHGIRLMLEGVGSAAQFSAIQNLAAFDYLLVSARILQSSLDSIRARQELDSLIAQAHGQNREVCTNGLDTPALLAHARSLNVDIGFGRECGKSEPFPDLPVA